jgi:ABC-type branched-subunit amino acid transport system permease subunit
MSTVLSLQFWAFVGVVAGIYTIFSLGIQLQFGFTGLLNFGHVAFMAIAAYTMAILVVRAEMSMWIAAPIAIAMSTAFGLVLGLPTLRLRTDYLAIATISFGEIVRYIALNETQLTGGPQGTISLLGPGEAASYNDQWLEFQDSVQDLLGNVFGAVADNKDVAMFVIVWSVALVLMMLLHLVVRSPWGRVLKSVREDEDAARALGKNVFSYKLQSLALGSTCGAIAGLFFAWQFSFFSPTDFEPLTTFFAWIIVILGGTAKMWGVPVGAMVFGVIFAGTRFFEFPPFSLFSGAERAYLRLIIIGIVLIGLLAFRPQGMFGNRQEMVLE